MRVTLLQSPGTVLSGGAQRSHLDGTASIWDRACMILVAGSANLDFVVRTPHIPAPGETVLGGEFRTYPGGKGANQAVACARAGAAETSMLLALGNDAYAGPIEQ